MKEETIKILEKLASNSTLSDFAEAGEFLCIDDYAGGNIDDAYFREGQ